ncbi:MAG TPA: ParB/RepB/Spo0J family partition protein [Verrucomicrobiaceae bacterium]|jgi:ParB family chromosome partitioning protein
MATVKPALGKGLGALIGRPAGHGHVPLDATAPSPAEPAVPPGERVRKVSLAEVVPSPLQPRKDFAGDQLTELMDSIREHGIIQPLIVRLRHGKHELIAGERRWRASRELGLAEVPVIVREASDKDVLEMALIENLQREGLNPIEEAQAYQRLAREFSLRQEDIAQRVGKNRATVANAIRLLELPSGVQQYVREGKLSTGHAKVLLSLKAKSDMDLAADQIIAKSLTVRGTERMVDHILNPPKPKPQAPAPGADLQQALRAIEQKLTSFFATAAAVQHGEKKGRIELEYYGVDDLNRLLGLMGVLEDLPEGDFIKWPEGGK